MLDTISTDMTSASLEIIVMLSVAFLLGFLLRHVLCKAKKADPLMVSMPKRKTANQTTTNVLVREEENLKIIDGIEPRVEQLLKEADIKTFRVLANSDVETLRELLKMQGGPRYANRDPSSWPQQAKLAESGAWEKLKTYQQSLH